MGRARAQAQQSSGSLLQVSAHTSMVDTAAREEYVRVLGSMCQKLKSVQYNGSYFDRGAEASSRLCTAEGWFSCQVRFLPRVLGRLRVRGREDVQPLAEEMLVALTVRVQEGGGASGVQLLGGTMWCHRSTGACWE